MKLFSELKNQIRRLGVENIRQAWFTSFNLSPHFVETYILQALAGSNEKLTAIADYEALQQKLLDQKIDIRFFSDAAAVIPGEPKRTFFNFHLLNPELLSAKFKNGVFHPKVIFLRADDGSAIVGVGSANLTVSGWGRNREVFLFKKIDDATNKDRVLEFFRRLFEAAHVEFPSLEISVDESNSHPDWLFLSSLNNDKLLDHLKSDKNQEGDRLSVWSPYFSEDIIAYKRKFIDPHFGQNMTLEIYPDFVESNGSTRIRIPDDPNLREKLAESADIRFRKMHWPESTPAINMTHAKLWHFGRKMAIGSWNFTQAGTNVHLDDESGQSNCNVEAGILLNDVSIQDIQSSEIAVEKYLMPQDQLDKEKDDLPDHSDRLPFFLEVRFCWTPRIYKLTMNGIPDGTQWFLTLPGIKEPVTLAGGQESLDVRDVDTNALLIKRLYKIRKSGPQGNPITGIILEEGFRERPVYKFENFNALLDAWNTGRLEDKAESLTPRAANQTEGFEEIGDLNPRSESTRPDYFGMFRAFQNMHARISDETNKDELRRLIQIYPGSLWETAEKIAEIIEDRQNSQLSQVYLWHLKMEYQSVLKVAKQKADRLGLQIEWRQLSIKKLKVSINSVDQRLLALVMEVAEYDRSAA